MSAFSEEHCFFQERNYLKYSEGTIVIIFLLSLNQKINTPFVGSVNFDITTCKDIYFHPCNLPMMHLVWGLTVVPKQASISNPDYSEDPTQVTVLEFAMRYYRHNELISSFCSYFSLQQNNLNVTSRSSIR